MLVRFGLGTVLSVLVMSCFPVGLCSCLRLTLSELRAFCLYTFLHSDLSEGMHIPPCALLNTVTLSIYRGSLRCSCTPFILPTIVLSPLFTLTGALLSASRPCLLSRVVCWTRPIVAYAINLSKEPCISKRCNALSLQPVWPLDMGLCCMRRFIEIRWNLAH